MIKNNKPIFYVLLILLGLIALDVWLAPKPEDTPSKFKSHISADKIDDIASYAPPNWKYMLVTQHLERAITELKLIEKLIPVAEEDARTIGFRKLIPTVLKSFVGLSGLDLNQPVLFSSDVSFARGVIVLPALSGKSSTRFLGSLVEKLGFSLQKHAQGDEIIQNGVFTGWTLRPLPTKVVVEYTRPQSEEGVQNTDFLPVSIPKDALFTFFYRPETVVELVKIVFFWGEQTLHVNVKVMLNAPLLSRPFDQTFRVDLDEGSTPVIHAHISGEILSLFFAAFAVVPETEVVQFVESHDWSLGFFVHNEKFCFSGTTDASIIDLFANEKGSNSSGVKGVVPFLGEVWFTQRGNRVAFINGPCLSHQGRWVPQESGEEKHFLIDEEFDSDDFTSLGRHLEMNAFWSAVEQLIMHGSVQEKEVSLKVQLEFGSEKQLTDALRSLFP